MRADASGSWKATSIPRDRRCREQAPVRQARQRTTHYHPVPAVCQAKDDPLDALRADHPRIPRDRVIILEDTDNDGIADKRTVFVEGLNLASAILCGDGGVYVGQQPHLLHFRDTDGDDQADEWRVVLTGFGREDTHELLNSFCWGPDGWLYMTHGVFTNSKVRRPGEPEKGFKFDAGIGRCRPVGQSDLSPVPRAPDRRLCRAKCLRYRGNSRSLPTAPAIPGAATTTRAGISSSAPVSSTTSSTWLPAALYARQGGAPENPYAYELLPSIVKHKHFRAAYAGVQIYQGGVYPEDTWGHAFIGNIHDNAIHEEVLTPVGATFKCEPRRDFLRANDGWFRPVSTQTGPDGILWIMDWCDKYPCYQNAKANPEGRGPGEGEHLAGGANGARTEVHAPFPSRESRGMDLSKLSTPELVKLLGHSNNWMRRMATRQLVDRKDGNATSLIEAWVRLEVPPDVQLGALWTLHQLRTLTGALLEANLANPDAGVRSWVALLSGERFRIADQHLAEIADKDVLKTSKREAESNEIRRGEVERLRELERDPDMAVRSSVAAGLRMASSSSLTVDKPLPGEQTSWRPTIKAHNAISALLKSSAQSFDNVLQQALWMVIETGIAEDAGEIFDGALMSGMAQAQPLSHRLTYKSMRRLCDTREAKNLDLAVAFCEKIQSHDILLAHALDGLVKGQECGVHQADARCFQAACRMARERERGRAPARAEPRRALG